VAEEIDGEAAEKLAMMSAKYKKKKKEGISMWEKLYTQIRYSSATQD